jgi:superfamily I DNA/RNA helicase
MQLQVKEALTKFCQSGEKTISEFISKNKELFQLEDEQIEYLIAHTEAYWKVLIDDTHPAKISHDVYLKLYQIQEHKINGFDLIILDEAQDTSGCVKAIFDFNNHMQQLVVGDAAQQIYAFRGAVNALNSFNFESMPLTESFRFTQEIADKANLILAYGKYRLQLTGVYKGIDIKTQATICRTNYGVLQTIYNIIETEPQALVYTPINMQEIFGKLFHMQACEFGSLPKYPDRTLLHIRDKGSLLAALEDDEDLWILHEFGKKIAKTFGGLAKANNAFKTSLAITSERADFIVSTIHKFKGLEADHVTIHEDLIPISAKGSTFEQERFDSEHYEVVIDREAIDKALAADESLLNLIYVAITRARVSLRLPSYMENFLQELYEEFQDGK